MGSDLINRQDAIDAVVLWTVEDRPDAVMPTDLIDRLKQLPSAEPEPSQCWRCNCPKMQKTFSEMVHLHDAEDGGGA